MNYCSRLLLVRIYVVQSSTTLLGMCVYYV